MTEPPVRWGIVGCGDVTEVKSGPGFQKAHGSALVAVMRRDQAKAEDYARRHGVPRVYATADALIADPEVDAVYIATPPSSHCDLALRVAAAGKPCLVEKPMALNHGECLAMVEAFRRASRPLWVAYYRRALPRFLLVRSLLQEGRIGSVTSAHVELRNILAQDEAARAWVFDASIAGAGLIFDVGSHCVDLLDFFFGPISAVEAFPVNRGGAYAVEDVTTAAFKFESGLVGSASFNFHAFEKADRLVFVGPKGEISTPVFSTDDVVVRTAGGTERFAVPWPAHMHQPLIQSIVDELNGRGRCASTGETGARASWVLDRCVARYRDTINSNT
jgi:1,5-anhydro-D-fructose reductase (1,5-anhydro-D-mannitol-forming)